MLLGSPVSLKLSAKHQHPPGMSWAGLQYFAHAVPSAWLTSFHPSSFRPSATLLQNKIRAPAVILGSDATVPVGTCSTQPHNRHSLFGCPHWSKGSVRVLDVFPVLPGAEETLRTCWVHPEAHGALLTIFICMPHGQSIPD